MRGHIVDDLCVCLTSFQHMSKIISIVLIDKYEHIKDILHDNTTITADSLPEEIAAEVIATYEYHAKKLYTHGQNSVLTRFSTGDHETFYFHAVRFYIPKFMRELYSKHKVGIALMTLEGFEYKNFTSKHVVSTRTNGKGNVCMQSLRVLQLFFKTGYHNVLREIKVRKVKEDGAGGINQAERANDNEDYNVDQLIQYIIEAV